jgi:hypothetical protein
MLRTEPTAGGHEFFAELCALYPTGVLSAEEVAGLAKHLEGCEECRARFAGYRQVVREGLPLLAEGPLDNDVVSAMPFPSAAAKKSLLAELDRREAREGARVASAQTDSQDRSAVTSIRKSGSQGPSWSAPRFNLLQAVAAAAVVVIVAAGSIVGWRWSRLDARQGPAIVATPAVPSDGGALRALSEERDVLTVKLRARDAKVSELAGAIERQSKEVAHLRDISDKYKGENAALQSRVSSLQAEDDTIKSGRAVVETQLEQAQTVLESMRKQLSDVEVERRNDLLHSASLEARVEQLSSQLKEQHSTVTEQESLLSSDRDIRELMGARDLYIADVFDVDPNSHTQKPFGRVFYTKNKSLIFYAFDLDQQPGVKNTKVFQAWGIGDSGKNHPLNLGVLYQDSEKNRRWVLRFEDANVLAKINAVFVTVEPSLGRTMPSGKQLLYAYISKQPNHP